jgi:hypothetical protein
MSAQTWATAVLRARAFGEKEAKAKPTARSKALTAQAVHSRAHALAASF